ncbi:hypothetical protein AGMMS49950_10830 [Endomicrobiia bacterium]|nr:hypothetical protein AGMMS49950_10830 [Endomicrobiia bacterium]
MLEAEVRDFDESIATLDKVTREAEVVKDRYNTALERASSDRKNAQERSKAAQDAIPNELFLAIYYNDDENNRTTQSME